MSSFIQVYIAFLICYGRKNLKRRCERNAYLARQAKAKVVPPPPKGKRPPPPKGKPTLKFSVSGSTWE